MQARASKAFLKKGAAAALARHFHDGRALAPLAQAPAVAQPSASSGSSGGLLSLLFSKASKPGPSMKDPLPGVPAVPPLQQSAVVPATAVTTLDNGLTIATQDVAGPCATVGVYVNSGSVWESPMTSGASHLLERMAFKSTAARTHFRLVREIEAAGANCLSSASREQMAYTADVIKVYVPEAVELLADTVRNSLFNDWEVKEQADRLRAELAGLPATNPQAVILEALHSAGYAGALGMPLMASPAALSRLNGQTLFDFVAANYTAPRMVVSAAGVDHEEFRALVDPLFSDMPGAAVAQQPQSQYVGGDLRMAAEGGVTHIALGFEFAGGWQNEKDSIALVVLQALMGGGLSFSAGGPGKGMYSRLYKRVLNKYAEVQACSFFSSLYNSSGIVGIQATAPSEFVPQLVDVVVKELTAVAAPGGVTEEDLQRAKNATVASVLMNLESRAVVAEDIGRQILTYGERKGPEYFTNIVNNLTPKDMAALAQKFLKTPLSFASYGDVVHVPRFDQVSARFS